MTPDPLAALLHDLFSEYAVYDNHEREELCEDIAARLRDAGVEMGLDVERLARAMYPDPLAEDQTWDDAMRDAEETAAAYARLAAARENKP